MDLEARKPIDMFDGRDGESLAAWLREHPEVEVICRDRASGYGEGARDAPQAIQVADRFHLWKNLGEAVEKTGNEHRARLVEPSPEAAASSEPPPVVEPLPEKKTVKRLGNNYADVHKLRSQGLSKAAIGRKLGLHPATVRKFCNARSVDNLIAKTEQRAHIVDAYTGYLHRRWNEGERNATKLFREIVELAYKGGELAVQRNLRRYREGRGHAPRTGPKPPSIREATSWIMRHPDNLSSDAATAL